MALTQAQRRSQAAAVRQRANSTGMMGTPSGSTGAAKGGSGGAGGAGGTAQAQRRSAALQARNNPSIMTQAADNYSGANDALDRALSVLRQPATSGYNPASVGAGAGSVAAPTAVNGNVAGYDAATYQGQGYGATGYEGQGYTSQGYEGNTYEGQGYDASQVDDPALIAEAMKAYINPYTDQVIDTSLNDIDRTRRVQQTQNAGNAAAAGAFGGGRHGVVEAETNRAALDQSATTAAGLRSRMFATAAGLGAQDIGNRIQVGTTNAQLMDAARAFTAAANNTANQFNADSRNTADRFTAGAANEAGAFGAAARNAADQYTAAAENAAAQYGASARNTANAANAAARNAASSQAGQGRLTGALANQQSELAAATATANNNQQAALADAAARNRAEEFNRQLAVSDRQSTADSLQRLASAYAGVGGQQFNTGRAITADQASAGSQVQALQQALATGAASMFDQYTNSPAQTLALRLQALGINPGTATGTQTQTTTGGGKSAGNAVSTAAAGLGALKGA